MTDRRWTLATTSAIALLAGVWARASADAPTFKRIELTRHDLATPGREAVLVRVEFPPGTATPRHTHPGDEIGVVLEGEFVVELEGKPAMTLKAGDSYFVPAGTVHAGKHAGKTATVALSTYIIEKGKPLATTVK